MVGKPKPAAVGGGTPPQLGAVGGAGKGGGRQKQASTLPVRGGKREMKAYAVTEDELENLGFISFGSTAAFSIASFLAAFFLSVRASVSLSSGVAADVLSYWKGLSIGAGIAAVVCALIGIILVCKGRSKIRGIKETTDHG